MLLFTVIHLLDDIITKPITVDGEEVVLRIADGTAGWNWLQIIDNYMYPRYRVDVSWSFYQTKSTLERVSNAVYCCINSIFHELRHDSAMNRDVVHGIIVVHGLV